MINIKELENDKIEVSSSIGCVDIGPGPVKKLIIDKDELELVAEIDKEPD